MAPAPPGKRSIRPAAAVLLLAWLGLLGGVAAAGGYVLMLPAERLPGATAMVLTFGPPADEPPPPEAETAALPPPAAEPEVAPAKAPEPPKTSEPAAPPPAAAEPKAAPAGALALWQRNRQPFDEADSRPRIAVVLTGLGLSSATTEAAITQLPGAVTLSFTPYSRQLDQWVALARKNGHEVMLDLPMEPTSYPDDDPGPQALLTALSPAQNLERLAWTLGRADGYVGVATVMGSRFTAAAESMQPILEAVKSQGLIFLDNRSSDESVAGALAAKTGVASAINDRALDSPQASPVAIDSRLVQLETIARANGFAVAMGRPYPMTIDRLRNWMKGAAERGFALAPISAVVDRQRQHSGRTQSTLAE